MKLIIICLEKLWAPLDIRKRTVDFSSDLEVFPTAAMLHHTVQKRMRPLWIPIVGILHPGPQGAVEAE